MSQPITRIGGIVHTATGEKILAADLDRVGTMGQQGLYNLLAAMFLESVSAGVPLEGFPGDHCLVTVSVLTATIAKGVGFFYDTGMADNFAPIYTPIVVPTSTTQAINAHHATLPRWDLISLSPNTSQTESQTRNLKDPGDGSLSSSSVYKIYRPSYTVTYTAGTAAATPADPTPPAGSITIARIRVPATSGAVSVDDLRPLLRFSRDWAKDPSADYATSFVPGVSTQLSTNATSPASMQVYVESGEGVVLGNRYRKGRTYFTIGTADPTNPRIDVVAIDVDGTLSVTAGTPAGSPSAPSISATKMKLAEILVDAATTTIASGKITDFRERTPITGYYIRDASIDTDHLVDAAVDTDKLADAAVTPDKLNDECVTDTKLADDAVTTRAIDDGAVTAAKLSVVPVYADLTVGAENGSNEITVSIQVKDLDGNNYAGVVRLECEVYTRTGDSTGYYIDIGASGSVVSMSNDVIDGSYPYELIDTNASGQAQVVVTGPAGATKGARLKVTPIGKPGYPNLVQCPFN